MSENITDIKKWNELYPFLEEVWTTYNAFDKDVVEEQSKYFNLCSLVLKNEGGHESTYMDFCMKFMRNLGYYSLDTKFYAPSYERCNILKNWIYNSISKNRITVDIITNFFAEYIDHMGERKNKTLCNIDTFEDTYKEQIYITLLHIFETNIHIIKEKLNGHNMVPKIPCHKFVCDCLKIYYHMKELYCQNTGYLRGEHKDTCLKLSLFENSYNILRGNIVSANDKIPALGDKDNECFENKPQAQLNTLLTLTAQPAPRYVIGEGLAEHDEGLDGPRGEEFSTPRGNEDSPMKKTITTTIGTVAGASSLLAFLYKFTPARRLVNPKLRRTTGMINNNFYGDDANGMLFDGNEHNGFDSYNIGYEAV